MKSITYLALAITLLLPTAARAQTTVEVTGGSTDLSNGLGTHTSSGIRLRHERPRDIWYLGVSRESRQSETGWLGNVSNTHTLSNVWTSHLSATTSTDAFFLPRYRFDGQLARKLGGPRAWVVTGSLMTSASRDEHSDVGAGFGVLRFLPAGFAVEGSVMWKRTMPEDFISRRQNAALTWYRPAREVSVRAGFGEEGFQLISADSVLVGFNSHDVTVRWLEWLGPTTGIAVSGSYYKNPAFHSSGYSVTVVQRLGS